MSCDCDYSGSKSAQCDQDGQCPCNDNVEGRTCDRCKENKHNRHQGCLDCPHCYNLVQDAANAHRAKIGDFDKILTEISENPTVIEDDEFEAKLKALNEKVTIVVEDARAGAGSSSGKSLTQKMEDLREQLFDIESSLKEVIGTHDDSKFNYGRANANLKSAQEIIKRSQEELNVSLTFYRLIV